MHNYKSLSRELSLISLGLIKDKGDFNLNKNQIDNIFESALESLINTLLQRLQMGRFIGTAIGILFIYYLCIYFAQPFERVAIGGFANALDSPFNPSFVE